MKKPSLALTVILVLGAFSLTGCVASAVPGLAGILGVNRADLEKARKNGITEEFPFSKVEAYYKVLDIIEDNGLVLFQQNLRGGYIVAMGFPKQTDTTRVGIFFERLPGKRTRITLSSLSSTALGRANNIIFGNLRKQEPTSDKKTENPATQK